MQRRKAKQRIDIADVVELSAESDAEEDDKGVFKGNEQRQLQQRCLLVLEQVQPTSN